jgi:hypothetical protein
MPSEAEILSLGRVRIIIALGFFTVAGLWSVAMSSEKAWKAMYNGATFPLVFGYLSHVITSGGH